MTKQEAAFVSAISEARSADAVWQALEALAAHAPGHSLFTATVTDIRAGLVRRAYSNRPVEYPASGTKPLHGNTGDWFETVFTRHETFVANTIEDIARVFPDHELIGSMGLGSVVNLPVVLEGDLVATINLLAPAQHYTPDRVAEAESLAIPARLCTLLSMKFEPLTGAGQ